MEELFLYVRLCAHEVVSERFHNSQNENDINYKNSRSDRMKSFSLDEVYAGFH